MFISKGGIRNLLFDYILAVLIAGVFLFMPLYASAAGEIIISEVGAYEQTGHEWVEIYNRGSEPADMSGWVFWENEINHGLSLAQGDVSVPPGAYAIIAQDAAAFIADYPSVTTTIFDSAWSTLKESGEEIGLKDAAGNFIEQFSYISASDFSLERMDAESGDYTAANWKEHPDGNSAGKSNFWEAQGSLQDDEAVVMLTINEFLSDPAPNEKEWVELYNAGTEAGDLAGWSLHDGLGKIAELSGAVPAGGFFIFELSINKLNNEGDKISLYFGEILVDSAAYGEWDDGNTLDNAPAPAKGASVGRKPDGADTGADAVDFFTTSEQSPASANAFAQAASPPASTLPPAPSASPAPQASSGGSSVFPYPRGSVVINEIVSDPADDGEEFVELFNTRQEFADLFGWQLEDGGEARTALSGNIAPRGFYVIEKPKGNLNNSGDRLILYDGTGRAIDAVSYGAWDDGNVYDNAPSAADPFSIVRRKDGLDTDNDALDFVLTDTVTKGKSNVVSGGTTEGAAAAQSASAVVINELYPNPEGSDSEGEFIELLNIGSSTAHLGGWQLGDNSARRFILPAADIPADGFALFYRKQTGIALNNTGGDTVRLFDVNGVLRDSAAYSGAARERESYARDAHGAWNWSMVRTPGVANRIEMPDSPPVVVLYAPAQGAVGKAIVFDASDTTDADDDELSFAWDFGDGTRGAGDAVEHIYREPGVYEVVLTVSAREAYVTARARMNIVEDALQNADFSGGFPMMEGDGLYDFSSILINEIFPNPAGSDTGEFVELFNGGGVDADISGMKLDDEDRGSRAYTLPEGTVVPHGGYAVFFRPETKLALNNTGDTARLMYPDDTVFAQVDYGAAVEGASYARDQNGDWGWTNIPTPGAENEIVLQYGAKSAVKTAGRRAVVRPITAVGLAELRDEDIGDRVRVRGAVAALPGVFGQQYMYISGDGAGVQVYSHKKDFPELAVGDMVEVVGEISQAYGETRLKVAGGADMRKTGSAVAVEPMNIDIADIGEPSAGALVRVQGEITDVKKSYLWVDDGTEEIKVYAKTGTGLSLADFLEGDIAEVVGIVQERAGGFQILPRGAYDVNKLGRAENEAAEGAEGGEAASGFAGGGTVAETYLTATAGGITSIILGLLGKMHGGRALGFARRAGGVALSAVRRRKV